MMYDRSKVRKGKVFKSKVCVRKLRIENEYYAIKADMAIARPVRRRSD